MPQPKSPRHLLVCIVACHIAFLGWGHAADVKVAQGERSTPELILASPMILEMALEAAAPDKVGVWVPTDDFDKYTCDYVHIRRIESRVLPRKDRVDLSLRIYTFTELSRDKSVRMEFTLRHDSAVLAETVVPHIDAEEGKRGYGSARMSIPKEKWPAEGIPTLHIVVHVKNY